MNGLSLGKALASVAVIISFTGYAAYTRGDMTASAQQPIALDTATGASANAASAPAPEPAATAPTPSITRRDDEGYEGYGEGEDEGGRVVSTPAPQPVTPSPAPQPALAPAPKPKGRYVDGTYTGSSEYVYYGNVQVEAIIQNGKLADVKFLDYPHDRGTSREINSQAMPYLSQEAVAAQSANVSGVSGATDTSIGFIRSLGNALAQAKA